MVSRVILVGSYHPVDNKDIREEDDGTYFKCPVCKKEYKKPDDVSFSNCYKAPEKFCIHCKEAAQEVAIIKEEAQKEAAQEQKKKRKKYKPKRCDFED